MVCKLVHPHSVLELSRVRCRFSQGQGWGAWAFVCVMCCRTSLYTRGGGGGHRQNHDWTPPPLVHSIAVLHSSGRSPSPHLMHHHRPFLGWSPSPGGGGRTDVL